MGVKNILKTTASRPSLYFKAFIAFQCHIIFVLHLDDFKLITFELRMGVKEDQPEVIRSWPKMMRMKCYTKKEILSMSVKEITSTAIANDDNVSAIDGLYDPALGPTRRGERCVTCGLQGRQCPGHCGHITLADPVYNVLFYSELKQILKATCRDCSQVNPHFS